MRRSLCSAALALCLAPLGAGAESAFTMPYPAELGVIGARAYDEGGQALPIARLAMERLDGDRVAIRFEAGEADGARMDAHAVLGPAGERGQLRLLEQHSLSTDPSGRPLRAVEVDHEARRARCYGPDGEIVDEIALEPRDRVVNVPMNLFFLPLVRGERERLEFELFLCRSGAQRVPFAAWVEATDDPRGVRVSYGPDYGLMSGLARHFAPQLDFWFQPSAPHLWQGHRLPLYTEGPEVLIVRDAGARSGSGD